MGREHLFIIVDTVTLIFPSFRAPVFNNVTEMVFLISYFVKNKKVRT